ncbi:Putative ribonuclease H protein At1g65750 [Linum grandiflorum]
MCDSIWDDCSTAFSTDRWLGSWVVLTDHILPSFPEPDLDVTVISLCTELGNWDFDLLLSFLPANIVSQIAGSSPHRLSRGEDCMTWGMEKDGRFQIRSLNDLQVKTTPTRSGPDWKIVWRWKGPHYIKHFMWLATHDLLLKNEERIRCHLTESGVCPCSYSINLVICSITRAELRAVVQGLQLAWELGYRLVRVQLDSRVVIQFLLAEGEITHQHSSEVASFREVLDRNWLIKVEHIYREGNRAVDYLAGHGHSLPLGVHSISPGNPTLSLHILYELLEVFQSRLIMNER